MAEFDRHHPFGQPRRRRRLPSFKLVLIIIVIIAAVAGGICYINSRNEAPPRDQYPRNQTSKPTTTNRPWPTSTTGPTPTPTYTPAPTPTTAPSHHITAIAREYAHCQGAYQGAQLQERLAAAVANINRGLITAAELRRITQRECAGDAPQPTDASSPVRTDHPTHFARLRGAQTLIQENPEAATAFMVIPWVHDMLDPKEAQIARAYLALATSNPEVALAIAKQPFLTTPEHHDRHAIAALARIARQHPEAATQMVFSPAAPTALTDENAPVYATLGSLDARAPARAAQRLAHDRAHPLNFQMPSTGTATVSTVGPQPQPHIAHAAALSAAKAEEFMGIPLPTDHIIIQPGPDTPPDMAATFHGTHIVIRPQHIHDHIPLIAHEITHYYWHGNQEWLDEGIAAAITDWILETTGQPPVPEYDCPDGTTILQATHNPEQYPEACIYQIARDMFNSLHETLGSTTFANALASLWLEPDRTQHNLPLDLRHLRQHLGVSPQAKDIIDHHYHARHPDNSQAAFDISPPRPSIPSLHATIAQSDVLDHHGQPTDIIRLSRHTGPVRLIIASQTNVPNSKTAELAVRTYRADGSLLNTQLHTIANDPASQVTITTIILQPPKGEEWQTGRHWAMVYDQDTKVAQVQWQFAP